MCAIGGIYLKPSFELAIAEHLKNMLDIQRHRGPDAEGIWLANDNRLGVCHNRLSILDLTAAGNQPMHSSDDRYHIVFNGEIYNYRELQSELKNTGVIFKTHSDTEVLIEAYRAWGEDMLLRLRGMFAFAIYDQHTQALFCARDRVGKKPFIYAQTKSAFIFASEIPAVKHVPGVDVSYDHDAIAAMLLHNLRHIPDPYTAFHGIKRLRAGHAMIIKNGTVEKIWRYWNPTPASVPITPQQLRQTIEEAIHLRMQADVPVGALLSGGVDSSAIVALMQKQSVNPIHTYALGFDKDDEDLRRARQMAHALNTIHKEYYFDPTEQWHIFKKLIHIYGEPIMLLPLVHTYTLCRAIQDDGIKVVLTGNGADEIFYGYSGHIRTLKISRWLDHISPFRPLLKPLALTRLRWLAAHSGQRKAAYYQTLARKEWRHCLSQNALHTLHNRAAEQMRYWGELCPSKQYIDESNFVGLMVENPHSVTIAGDLPAMAASIEMRAPFLDQEIISFALATSPEKKIPDLNNPAWLKAILREAVADLIPESLLKAPKRGFGMGIQERDLLRGPWKEKAIELFESPNTADGLFSKDAIQKTWQEFINGNVPAIVVAKQLAIQEWLTQ
ncbi:MAG: asparagine synthase (glutamine-hydrolyzing) [Pseudomonadota bacterium]